MEWADWVGKTALVIPIGVRPWLADVHVWNPIIQSTAQILYVGGRDGDYGKLEAALGKRLSFGGSTFETGLDSIREALERFA